MVLFKKQSSKNLNNNNANNTPSRPPIQSAPGSTLSAKNAYEASKKLTPPPPPPQNNSINKKGGFIARSEQDRYPSIAPPESNKDENDDTKDDDDNEDENNTVDKKGVGPDGAIYTIFTSPNHAPRPDHLPTLIVTAFSMPGTPQEILYTYLHTNYNSEQYLLTPSKDGDLCVARMLPPSFSKIEKKKDKEHLPIVCEGSRQLKWKITDTGRYQPTYLVTVPPARKDDGPDNPLFKISKVNPQSPFWTMSYFVKPGHAVSAVAVPFGKIQKNLPKYGGGTRVTIYGRNAQERKVWSTLGEENPDMVEWVVLSAALSVLDDEIIKATQAAEGPRGLQRLRPDVRRTVSTDPVRGGKMYRIDTTKPSNPRRRRIPDDDSQSAPPDAPAPPQPPRGRTPGPPDPQHGLPPPGPGANGIPPGHPMVSRAPTTRGPPPPPMRNPNNGMPVIAGAPMPPPGARPPGAPSPAPSQNGRPLYPPYNGSINRGPPPPSPGRIVTNGPPSGYVGPRSAPPQAYGGGIPPVLTKPQPLSNKPPLPMPGSSGPDRSVAPSAPPAMDPQQQQAPRLPMPGSLSRNARTPGPGEGNGERPRLPNPYEKQSSSAPPSQANGLRAPMPNSYYIPNGASNTIATPSQSTYISGSRPLPR